MSSRSRLQSGPAKERDEGKLLFTGNTQLLTFLSGHQLQTPNHIPRDYCVSPRMDWLLLLLLLFFLTITWILSAMFILNITQLNFMK